MSSGSSLSSAFICFLLPFMTANLLTDSIIPIAIDMTTTDVPPFEIRGNGCPLTGNNPVTMAIWTNAWNTISTAHPIIRNAGNALEQ